jgi:hypothetical protein
MTEEENDKLELIINGWRDYPDADLTKWEHDFMQDTADRFEQYGSRTRVSEKQWEILDRIWGKLPL